MILRHMSDRVKLLLKLTALLMFVFSTSSTKQFTPKKTENDAHIIRNIGIKLCHLKCAEYGECLSIEYDINTLTCRLLRDESKKITKEGQVILARDHAHVETGSSTCRFGQRCLKTRSGKDICVQDEKQNDPEKPPQHKVDKQETFANNQLHEACRKGDLNQVRDILSQGLIDINIRDEQHGRTPLMIAAQEGHCKVFKFLISKTANKSDVDNDGNNVVHWACMGGHVGMSNCILPEYGVNVSVIAKMVDGGTGYKTVFESLVCMGRNVSTGTDVLRWACTYGEVAIVKYLVSQGCFDINSRYEYGRSPLTMAVLHRHKDVFDFLVSIGANVSHADDEGHNILHMAASCGDIEILRHILSQNLVDIDARDSGGRTAAMIAWFENQFAIYNILLSQGCPVQ